MITAAIDNGGAIAPPGLKYCPKCEEWKAATLDNFFGNKSKPDGLQAWCKVCHKAYRLAWSRSQGVQPRPKPDLETQKARRAEYDKAYHADHREKRAEQRRERYQGPDKERLAEIQRQRTRRYREANPDKVRAKNRKYYQDHCEQEKEKARKRAAARRAQRVPKPRSPKPPQAPLDLQPELQQAITAFLNVKALKRPGTLYWYTHTLSYYARHLLKKGLPQWSNEPEIWADNVNSFLAAKKAGGMKDGGIDGYYRALTAWLRWLKRRKKIEGDLTELIEMIERPPRTRSLPKVVKEDDAARLLAALAGGAGEHWLYLRDQALIILALDSGVRIGELVNLTLDKLDMKHRTIAARDTKSNADRTIVFSERAAEPLTRWLLKRAELSPPASLREVFLSDYQNHGWRFLTTSGMRLILQRWQKRAGIARFNFHRLRHSYAVYTLRAGGDLLDIQKQMGHSSIATTAIYARVDDTGRQGRHNTANPLGYLSLQGGAL